MRGNKNQRFASTGDFKAGLCARLLIAAMFLLPSLAWSQVVIYQENFENNTNQNDDGAMRYTTSAATANSPAYPAYTGVGGQTYTGAVGWVNGTNCNGIILSKNNGPNNTPVSTAGGARPLWAVDCANQFTTIANMAQDLGAGSLTNHAQSAYTNAVSGTLGTGSVNGVMFQTVTPIAVTPNRFYAMGADTASYSCGAAQTHGLYNFGLLNGAGTFVPATAGNIDVCLAPFTNGANGTRVKSITSTAAIRYTESSLRVVMYNNQGNQTSGNDNAFDNVRLLDVTPRISKAFAPAAVSPGQSSVLTFTINNTTDNLAKINWSFTDNLPTGLTLANTTVGGTCTNAAGTAGTTAALTGVAGGNTITLNGSLPAVASCTITVNVTVGASVVGPATLQNCAANFTALSFIDPPTACANLTVLGPTQIVIVKDAVPDGPRDFNFTTTGTGLSSFSLDDDADATLSNTRTFTGLAAGAYSVTEAATPGWNLTGLTCVDPTGNSTGSTATGVASINLAAGETVTCTYTNTEIVQPNFGTCDARMYLSQGPNGTTNTTLYNINTSSNPFTFPAIAQGSHVYNSLGYNPLNNYLYGIQANGGTGNTLIRIGADGSSVNLGVVTNLPVLNFNSGDFDPSGNYYVFASSTNILYQINVGTLVATPIPLTSSITAADIAYVGGLFYTVDTTNGQLKSIDPTTGTVTNIGAPAGTNIFGALFGAPNGLYGNANGGQGFFKVDLLTGTQTLISGSPGSAINDGAHCVTAPITFASDVAISKTDNSTTYVPGSNVVYTIAVTNSGPFGVQNVTVADPLPSGITTANWTCAGTGGATCAASGTGAINDATVDLPVGGVATYTLTMAVPAGFTGNLVNTATATLPAGSTDPTPGNNTATDTDTRVPVLRLRKSLPGGRLSSGDQFTLTIAGTGGPATATTTGTGTTATEVAVLATATAGSAYTFSEAASGSTVLANYTTTWSCTNAASGGQTPSGSGASFSVTPVAGDDLTCTFTNTAVVLPNFGTCDARMYLSQGPDANTPTTLQLINAASNPFTYPVLGVGSVPYNAIGYNPLDNYLYGMRSGTGAGNLLVRVGADGSTQDLGPVAGMPTNLNYLAGDISPTGVYYVKEAVASTLYAVNLSTMTATGVALSQSFSSLDIAWIGGTLYAVGGGGQLYSINPATGAVATIGSTTGLGSFGAQYGAPNGLYANNNLGTGFYQYDLVTGIPTLISSSPGSATNDGAHCVTAPITFGSDVAISKTDNSTTFVPGTNVVYTVAASNNGPFGVQNVTVSDPLPAGTTTASWTCVGTGGATCAASGTGAINDNTVDLPVGGVATYTLTLTVPAGFTGDLVNTVTATVPAGATDPVPGNNSATDTDTQSSVSDLSITKSNPAGNLLSGATTTYNIVVSNAGPSAVANAKIVDLPATGLSCITNPTCTSAGGAICPLSLAIADLQNAATGLIVPLLPANSTVTLALTCTVTATGQ